MPFCSFLTFEKSFAYIDVNNQTFESQGVLETDIFLTSQKKSIIFYRDSLWYKVNIFLLSTIALSLGN